MSKTKEKKGKGIAGFLLVFGWLLFILFAVIFYFYFWEDFPFNPNRTNNVEQEVPDSGGVYQSVYSYQTNSNIEINALISDYFDAYVNCDEEKLKSLVTDPSAFDDMQQVKMEAEYITGYYNINCYTLPGASSDATLVYTTSNIYIADVSVSPLEIHRFYVRQTEDGYKIDNGTLTEDELKYIENMQSDSDIQGLYQAVNANINQYIESDPSFAQFYSDVMQVE